MPAIVTFAAKFARKYRASNQNRYLRVAVKVEKSDAAAVCVAPIWLKLGDDLHGADFGRTAERACGEDTTDRVKCIYIVRLRAVDVAYDMHHALVAHDAHGVFDRDAFWLADAAYVVASEVDEHLVLG